MSEAGKNTFRFKVLRGTSLIFAFFGILLFVVLLFDSRVEWEQNTAIHQSWLTEVWFVIVHLIFASGLPPLILTVYFWVLGKTSRDWRAGFAFVPIFVFTHYVVTVFMAHSSPVVYVPMMGVELLSVAAVIWYWHQKTRIDRDLGSN